MSAGGSPCAPASSPQAFCAGLRAAAEEPVARQVGGRRDTWRTRSGGHCLFAARGESRRPASASGLEFALGSAPKARFSFQKNSKFSNRHIHKLLNKNKKIIEYTVCL